MFKLDIDDKNNILTIKFSGRVNALQTGQLYEIMREMLSQLQNDFTILTDLSELEAMDRDAHSAIDSIMELCREKGVSRVISIIPDKYHDIGFNIMALFHYPPQVRMYNCKTLEEAKANLLEFK